MKLELKRLTSRERVYDTIGILLINSDFACFTLEDRFREVKVPKVTRIPAGTYSLTLRTWGTHHEHFLLKYGEDWHKGMIQLQNVPNFSDILIHVGNTATDTDGCILIGLGLPTFDPEKPATILASVAAYERIYPIVRDAILKESTYIVVSDSV
jgi:hypothetical protein